MNAKTLGGDAFGGFLCCGSTGRSGDLARARRYHPTARSPRVARAGVAGLATGNTHRVGCVCHAMRQMEILGRGSRHPEQKPVWCEGRSRRIQLRCRWAARRILQLRRISLRMVPLRTAAGLLLMEAGQSLSAGSIGQLMSHSRPAQWPATIRLLASGRERGTEFDSVPLEVKEQECVLLCYSSCVGCAGG
jgi:hypothetical protein